MADWRKRKKKGFLDEFLKSGNAPDPSKLARHSIQHDKYDVQDEERLREQMQDYANEADRFCDTVETGNALWSDTYWSLVKVEPKHEDVGDMQPQYVIDHTITSEAMELKEWDELRSLGTVGDEVAAAMGTMAMRPDLETLHDRLKTEQEKAKELQKQLQDLHDQQEQLRSLDEMIDDLDLDDPEDAKKAQDWQKQRALMNKQMEALKAQAMQNAKDFQQAMKNATPAVRQTMKKALGAAVKEAQEMAAQGDAWGLEPGTLQRMPAKERMELAAKLNNPRLKKIAELFGPMKRLMFTEQRRKVNHARDEVFDIGKGNDLARVLPVQFSKLRNPLMKLDFYREFIEGNLLQYEMRGEEKVGKGGIIYCDDSSGSMNGEPEMWAKAVGLCLLNLARAQKRSFRAITFGSTHQIAEFDFSKPEDYNTQKIIDMAEFSFMGGTDFMTPLSRSLDHLRAEFDENGFVKGDIVFATDGACAVNDQWMTEFKKEQERMGFTVWGIMIGGGYSDEPLATICDKRVLTIKDLRGGEDIRDIFGGIGGA